MKTIIVKNDSKVDQCLPDMPAFAAGQKREVSVEEASVILANPNFIIVGDMSNDSDGTEEQVQEQEEKAEEENITPARKKSR